MPAINRRLVLKERPRFQIPTAKCFRLEEVVIPKPVEGQIRIKTTWLGMDPNQFSKVKKVSDQSKPIDIGAVMYGATVGVVDISNHPDFNAGDVVHGLWGWQEFHVCDGYGITKIADDGLRPSYYLGALGAAGFGAYLAVNDVLKVGRGDVVFCSAATGALGQIVGQLSKSKGAIVYGSASSDEKCNLAVSELGYKACFNYKDQDFERIVSDRIETGIDAMVVSAGGKTFDATFPIMNVGGRIAVCGLMALYSMSQLPITPDRSFMILNEILLKRLSIKGSMVLDKLNTDVHFQFLSEMKKLINHGEVTPIEHVVEGLENAPDALRGVFDGDNIGKCVVHVAD
jgi:NADPH-dependent curcumin reductase CurA